jgi:hypothetical protein
MMTVMYSRMIRVMPVCAAFALGSTAAAAQKPPTAEQVIARHEAAVGGRAAINAHSSLRMTGIVIVAIADIRGSIEIIRARPNKYVEKMSLSQVGDMSKGYDGKTAWALDASEPGLLTDADAEGMKRMADWNHEFTVPQAMRGAKVDSAEFEGQSSWMLTYASGLGDEVRSYFNRETGLRIGEETSAGVGEATIIYGAYKSYGGVQFPTRITTRRGTNEMLINIVTVEFDKVPPSAFALPPAVKAIAKTDSHTPS